LVIIGFGFNSGFLIGIITASELELTLNELFKFDPIFFGSVDSFY
jgi:hypothetical protein